MNQRRAGWWMVVAAAGFPLAARGQIAVPPGPLVLRTPASVRSAALNGAGAALVGHAGSVFVNPAGLATIRHVALEGAYEAAAGDAFAVSSALGWRLRQFDLGFGVQYFDFGTSGLAPIPSSATGVDAREFLAVGSLVYRFGIIALGGTAKYLGQDVGAVEERGFSSDLGIAIAIFDLMAFGFVIQNLGENWRDSPLEMPRKSRFGFTMNYVDPLETYRLLSTLEVQWQDNRGARWVLGGEGGIVVGGVGIVARLAWGSRPQPYDQPPWTYGLSLELGSVDIDYAYEPADVVPSARRLGLRMAF